MSQAGQSSAAGAGVPVTNLTLVVLLLIPCVVLLLLLNCFFLVYKLTLVRRSRRTRRGSRGAMEELLLQSTLHRARRGSTAVTLESGRAFMSEPVLLSSSRAEPDHRVRLLRPDGATGSGSLKLPSSIRANSPGVEWCRSAPVLTRPSDFSETRLDLVPPNSPMQEFASLRRSSAFERLTDMNPAAAVHLVDQVDLEYSELPSEMSCLDDPPAGSGLDSDFGASAGVSLRILSADSDGLSNGVVSSALEWDYYDPCYVKQNHLPKHKHHRPVIHTRQYWV